jgi:hypothetical protein
MQPNSLKLHGAESLLKTVMFTQQAKNFSTFYVTLGRIFMSIRH